MSEFEMEDTWEVDKTAEKLNISLFGSGKKRKKPGSVFSHVRKNSSSAAIHDSDDEKFTKKGKKKLKERIRKQKKKQKEEDNGTEVSTSSDVKNLKKISGKQHKQEDETLRTDPIKEKTKKSKKKKKDDTTQSDTEEKKVKKRKRSSSEDPEHPSASKKLKTSVNERDNPNESKEASGELKKKRRNRKKKNNPKKNKYRHLALLDKETSEEGNRSLHVREGSSSKMHEKVHSKKGETVKETSHPRTPSDPKSKSFLKSHVTEPFTKKDKKLSDQTSEKFSDLNTKLKKKNKKKKAADLRKESIISKNEKEELTKGKEIKSQNEKGTLKNTSIKFDKNVLKKMLNDSNPSPSKKKKRQKRDQKEKKLKGARIDQNSDRKQEESIITKTKKMNGNAKLKESPVPSLWGKAAGLAEQARETLNSARFRYLNEQLYTCTGQEARGLFQEDKEAFEMYHEGYKNQVAKWEVNPLNVIIKQIKNKSDSLVIADLGCGEGRLAQSVPHRVHSFDLVALNKHVIACDMAKVPLPKESVDIVVFCLSLMGTNLSDYISEANRILKPGGLLKVAEVVSRFSGLSPFISAVCTQGFSLLNKRDLSQMFYLMDFKKVKSVKKSGDGRLKLKPCVYKKR